MVMSENSSLKYEVPYPNTALDISTVALPKRIRAVIVGICECRSLARLEEVVCRTVRDCLLRVVADNAVASALAGAVTTGTEKRDITAGNSDTVARAGDRDTVAVNIRDVKARTVVLVGDERDFDLRVGWVVGFPNENCTCDSEGVSVYRDNERILSGENMARHWRIGRL